MTIGIIGAGNMGGAVAKGLAAAGNIAARDIFVSDIAADNLKRLQSEFPQLNCSQDNTSAARCDVVVVAVKPWLVEMILTEIAPVMEAKQTLIVIAAGVNFEQIFAWLPEQLQDMPCLRLIPNTAIAVGQSMSLFSTNNVGNGLQEQILSLFRPLGEVVVIPESKMSAGTALTSCGTAYALRFVRAAVEAAVEMGFRPEEATRMVAQTMKGAAELLLQHRSHPEEEIDKVTTPGGITIKGLNAMEAAGFSHAVIEGIKASQCVSSSK
ncbi:MAG: pyrroline-5-carboxylate reductase [Bacteroidales bacterium]|nr:pyrroline-5-carboxylate reductase [Bacteroidales bacterium]